MSGYHVRLCLTVALAVLPLAGQVAARDPADVIIVGGRIVTMVEKGASAEALAVRGGIIVRVGPSAEVLALRGPDTRVIDAAGGIALPGLVDAHGHLMNLGRLKRTLDLVGTTSAAEVRRRVLDYQHGVEPGTWIWGRGWDQNDWTVKSFPTADMLEGTEANPVYLRRVDGHASWVNQTALERWGIDTNTADPDGGRIMRDASGRATGVIVDKADDLYRAKIPDAPIEEQVTRMRLAIRECNRYGLTGVHDAQTSEAHLTALRHLAERGELTLRVYCMLDTDEPEFAQDEMALGPRSEANGMIVIRAIKLYADGALGSRGARLLNPYLDDPGNLGLWQNTRETFVYWARLAMERGFQVCTHAIGDAANRTLLDVYEEVAQGRIDLRWRIEHAQIVSLADVRRFAELGVIASMQPTHCTSDMYWAEDRIGPERIRGAYAWRTLTDAGCIIACGSDFPVEGVNPLWGIYAAVTRQDHSGWPEGGWRPSERMTIDEAVRGFTTNAAYASFAEGELGTLADGKVADIVLLDRDIFGATPMEILETTVRYTIVQGRVVYESVE